MKLLEQALRLYCALVESEALVSPATLWDWDQVQEAIGHAPQIRESLAALDEASRNRVLRYTGAFEPLESLGTLYVFPTVEDAQRFVRVMENAGWTAEPYTETIIHAFGDDGDMMEAEAAQHGGVQWRGPSIREAADYIDGSLMWDMYCDGIDINIVQECILNAYRAPIGQLTEGLIPRQGPVAYAGRLQGFYTPATIAGVPAYVTEALRLGGFMTDDMHTALLEADPEGTDTSMARDRGGVADVQPDQTQGGAAASQSEKPEEPEKPTEYRPNEEQGAPDGDITLPDGTVVPKEVLQQAFVKFLDRLKAKLQAGTEDGQPEPRGQEAEQEEKPEEEEPPKPEEKPAQPPQPPAPSQPAATQAAGQPQVPPKQESWGRNISEGAEFPVLMDRIRRRTSQRHLGPHWRSVFERHINTVSYFYEARRWREYQAAIRNGLAPDMEEAGLDASDAWALLRVQEGNENTYESIDIHIPVVMPKGVPHHTQPLEEGTTGRIVGTRGQRLVVETYGGLQVACAPSRVLALTEGYDTDRAMLDMADGADVMEVARKRINSHMGMRVESAEEAQAALDEVKGGMNATAKGAIAGVKEGALRAAVQALGTKANGEKGDAKKLMQKPKGKRESVNVDEGRLADVVREIRDITRPGPVQMALMSRAEMLYDMRPRAQEQAVDKFHDAYAAMSSMDSNAYFRIARDLGLEERVDEAGPAAEVTQKTNVSSYMDATDSMAKAADTSEKPKQTAPQHTGAAKGTDSEKKNPSNPMGDAGKRFTKGTPARGMGEAIDALEAAANHLCEQLDTGEDAEREAAAQGFADAAERLKELRAAAFKLTTDDLVRLSSIMTALGNKPAATKLEKLRASLGNISDIAKKAGDELQQAHGTSGVGETPQEEPAPPAEPAPEAPPPAPEQPPANGNGAPPPAPAPPPTPESVMEADLGTFKKARWVAKNNGPFAYGQVVWALPEATQGDRKIWVAEDPYTRRGIYADARMVEFLEQEFRDEMAETMFETAIRRVLRTAIPEQIAEGADYADSAAAIRAHCCDLGLDLEQVAEVHRVASHQVLEEYTVSMDSGAHLAMSSVQDPIVQRLVMDTADDMVARAPGAVLMEVARVLRREPDPDLWKVAEALEGKVGGSD